MFLAIKLNEKAIPRLAFSMRSDNPMKYFMRTRAREAKLYEFKRASPTSRGVALRRRAAHYDVDERAA
jgi:hypothetical protein